MSKTTSKRLGDLIQPKGSASRPAEAPQRGQAVPASVTTAKEERKRSLTLKLTETQYQRLRKYGFTHEATHQTVIETALMQFLDKEGA
jgi:hypothetical protein